MRGTALSGPSSGNVPKPAAHSASGSSRPRSARLPPLLLPTAVVCAITSRRKAAGLEVLELAQLAHVPPARLALIEGGSAASADPAVVLGDLMRLAPHLGVSGRALVDLTLATWAAAYASGLGPAQQSFPTPLSDGSERLDPPTAEMPALRGAGSHKGPRQIGTTRTVRPRRRMPRRRSLTVHRLRLAAAAAASLILVAAGLLLVARIAFHGPSGPSSGVPTTSSPGKGPSPSSAQALTLLSSDNATASYQVAGSTYKLTITVDRPTWVEVGMPNGPETFAEVVQPGQTPTMTESSSTTALIGAGGASVKIEANNVTTRLQPSQAPFTYEFTPH